MNKTISTTIHCSRKEKELIESTAKKKGFKTANFINFCLDKNLPLKETIIFDLSINRKDYRLPVNIPQALHKKLIDNKINLNTEIKKIPMYHVVLTAVLMECAG